MSSRVDPPFASLPPVPLALARDEAELAASLGLIAEPALITRADLDLPGPVIIAVNAAFCALTGYGATELVGRTPRILQGPLTDRAVLARLRAVCGRGEAFVGETVNYRKDGTPYLLRWTIGPIRDATGVVTHFFALQSDVTAEHPFAGKWLKTEGEARVAFDQLSAQAELIAEAIAVLEKTKRSFQSKELGALRERLKAAQQVVSLR